MPELPEVETIRRDLQEGCVPGRRIVDAELQWPGAVRRPTASEFVSRLSAGGKPGERKLVREIARRGKYLVFRLEPEEALIVHLGMTGRLLLRQQEDETDPYLRASFRLDDGRELRFCDARKFGKLWLVRDEAEVVGKLGPEPLEPGFTQEDLACRLAGRGGPIKAILLDQGVMAGVGNIYADEALFLAGIHPLQPAKGLSAGQVGRLYLAIRQVLLQGIANRGTTVANYVSALGRAGHNQEALRVFRRTGQPCLACTAPIERLVVGGRSTHFCPRCQPV